MSRHGRVKRGGGVQGRYLQVVHVSRHGRVKRGGGAGKISSGDACESTREG